MRDLNRPTLVGIVGCGNISATYIATLHLFDFVCVKAVHDLDQKAAKKLASEFKLQAIGLEDLLNDPEIEVIINLTTPSSHAEIGRRVLEAGKHYYSEKPLGISMSEANELVDLAKKRNLRLGCAPDTFLGGGHQLTRRLIDEGAIGTPIAATALMLLPGHEHWHPNPHFFYGRGGGPMLDVGPYYVTNLIALFGSVKSVFGTAKITRQERVVSSEPRRGESIKVEVPTHITGILQFENGATVTMATSFDVIKHQHHEIEIYGSEGTMVTPDPNMYTGAVQLFQQGAKSWVEADVDHPYVEGVPGRLGLRGLGAAEMVDALRDGRPHRVAGDLALHALDVMTAFDRSSASGTLIPIASRCERPMPISRGIKAGSFS